MSGRIVTATWQAPLRKHGVSWCSSTHRCPSPSVSGSKNGAKDSSPSSVLRSAAMAEVKVEFHADPKAMASDLAKDVQARSPTATDKMQARIDAWSATPSD